MTSARFVIVAQCSRFTPVLSTRSTFAPASMSARTTAACPNVIASEIGESPDGFGRGFAFAPRDSSSDTVSRSPDIDAKSSGECLTFAPSGGSASAPASSKALIASALPR